MIQRHLAPIAFDLEFGRQMRFIAGPRQSGKTTLAKEQLKKANCEACYFNWDLRRVRSRYRENPLFYWEPCYAITPRPKKFWVCFDEIHKIPKWKNILKAAFDEKEGEAQFIITGSARLDWFRKSGDSLAGRYFLFHLLPITLRELIGSKPPVPTSAAKFIEARLSSSKDHQAASEVLLQFSGFPEPLTHQSKTFHQKWQEAYIEQLIREDLRDLTHIRELEQVAALAQILPSRIGSPLSVNALRQDLEVSFNALKNYLRALELSYVTFSLQPYHRKIARAVKKERKIYFYDWTRVSDQAVRFENFLASELHALVTLWNDQGLGPFGLHYVRRKDGKETDFLIVHQENPWLAIESKLACRPMEPHHLAHAQQLGGIPFVQLVQEPGVARKEGKNAWTISAERFLS